MSLDIAAEYALMLTIPAAPVAVLPEGRLSARERELVAASRYARVTLSMKAYLGQKVTIRFASSETLKGHATSFLIDNVALAVS